MKAKILFLIIFVFGLQQTNAQNINNESIAREYHRLGEFKKAAILFEDIYKEKKTKSIYDKYIDCLLQIQSYKKAEKTIKSFYKKTKNPSILIDLGKIYLLKNDEDAANNSFNLALNQAEKNKKFLPSLGLKLFKEKKYQLALKAYSLAKLDNNKSSYYIQTANIYSYLSDIEAVYNELIRLITLYPNYLQTCKNMIQRTITEDPESENNQLLKKILLKNIQKKNSYEISKLLIWLFTQEKKFDEALKYEIILNKNFFQNTEDILNLAEICISNKKYNIAIEAFEHIMEISNINSFNYEYSSLNILNIKFEIIVNTKIKKRGDIVELKKEYEKALEKFGVKSETVFLLKNYTQILNNYLNMKSEAVNLLESAIKKSELNEYDKAICKMELAGILISTGELWEAILIYSQIENRFKDDIIGHEAKLEKTKISYYQGDFEWAQNQLKVLKLSTSKLIANNAMQLSLLISDNLNLDTTDTALLIYAEAEFLFKQRKYNECLNNLENLENLFPNHSLIDEVLFKKFSAFLELKEYDQAIAALEKICKEHYYDILYDDALFYQAKIYEEIIKNNQMAKEKYEEILLKAPSSIFANEARERFRLMRKNNFLKL